MLIWGMSWNQGAADPINHSLQNKNWSCRKKYKIGPRGFCCIFGFPVSQKVKQKKKSCYFDKLITMSLELIGHSNFF